MSDESKILTNKILTIRSAEELQKALIVRKLKIQKTLPPSINVDRFIFNLVNAANKTPAIFQCKPLSILGAIYTTAQLGLEPNTPMGFAWLIPYKTNLTFQIGYKGLIELIYRTGFVTHIDVEVVYPDDTFEFTLGTDPYIKHTPNFSITKNRGDYKAVYAIAYLKDGLKKFIVIGKEEIEYIKMQSSKSYNDSDSPWKKWPDEMAKKTAIKRLAKLLPMTPEVAVAIEADNKADSGKGVTLENENLEGEGFDFIRDTAGEEPTDVESRPIESSNEDKVVNALKNGMQQNLTLENGKGGSNER